MCFSVIWIFGPKNTKKASFCLDETATMETTDEEISPDRSRDCLLDLFIVIDEMRQRLWMIYR